MRNLNAMTGILQVLSSEGCVGVKQDGGYADILVKKLEKLDQTSGADDIITY